ncbi:retrotransposon protein, putative, ty1-copia subclass, partial [Tanacetum coccineum]
MLMTMDPNIQKNLKQLGAYNMLKELKRLYAQQAEKELLQTVRGFYACKPEEGQSVSSYVLKMKSYIDNLERLGHAMNQNLAKNQKKKPHKAAKGNQRKGKAKMGYAPVPVPPFAPKPKNPPTPKKDNPAKDAICHQCGEFYAISNKRTKLNFESTLLWHCRLGHITKKRMEKLQHDGLLDSIDIKSFEKCVSCMSGKMARKPYSHQVEMAKDLLGLIHTDVCGPF